MAEQNEDLVIRIQAGFRGRLARKKISNPVSLYNRIGGEPTINAIVRGTQVKIFSDYSMMQYFRKANKDVQKKLMKDFLIYKTGGSKCYTGQSMRQFLIELGLT